MNNEKNRKNLKKIAYAGVLAALVFVGTELHIPTAIGHINLGDLVILVSSYILGPFAFVPAAIGSTLADLLAGYPQYAIATFIIKGVMGFVAGALLKRNKEGKTSLGRKLAASFVTEIIMIAGYFAFESLPFMYGVTAALGTICQGQNKERLHILNILFNHSLDLIAHSFLCIWSKIQPYCILCIAYLGFKNWCLFLWCYLYIFFAHKNSFHKLKKVAAI